MILWVILFVLVLGISFILAAKSMRDFSESLTEDSKYGLFLIRKTEHLTSHLLESIRSEHKLANFLVSFERLFKGTQSALVIFGVKKLLEKHKNTLDLLELEDYTNVDASHVSAWEVGIRGKGNNQKIFVNLPKILETEQFWWQLICPPNSKVQITAVIISPDKTNRDNLSRVCQKLAPDRLIKLPQAFSSLQILEFYQKRSIRTNSLNPALSSEEMLEDMLI